MTAYDRGLVSALAVDALAVALAIPLLMRKVPRNRLYGFRTRSTLADDRVWYEANAYFAVRLVVLSVFSALVLWGVWATRAVSPQAFLDVSTACLVAPSLLSVLATALFLRSLPRGGSGPGKGVLNR
jgi:hypothetical protein